jgi:hypothetical protein
MLVVQFVVFDFVNDSHGHVFIVNPIVNTGLRRSGRVIHKELILTGPNAFVLLVIFSFALLFFSISCCQLTFITQLPWRREEAPS